MLCERLRWERDERDVIDGEMKPVRPLDGNRRCVTWLLSSSHVIPSHWQQSEEEDQLRGRWGEEVDKLEEKAKSESLSIWLQEQETWTTENNKDRSSNNGIVVTETINLEKTM